MHSSRTLPEWKAAFPNTPFFNQVRSLQTEVESLTLSGTGAKVQPSHDNSVCNMCMKFQSIRLRHLGESWREDNQHQEGGGATKTFTPGKSRE